MAKETATTAAKSSPSTYVVLTKLHHLGPDWKKGEKQHFVKGNKIVLTDKEAEPLLKHKTIEAAR